MGSVVGRNEGVLRNQGNYAVDKTLLRSVKRKTKSQSLNNCNLTLCIVIIVNGFGKKVYEMLCIA